MQLSVFEHAARLIEQAGLARVAGPLKRLITPAIRAESRPLSPALLPLGASKLGGLPDLPDSFAWPSWKGVPMVFLAQINLQQVVPYDILQLLPPRGWLWFFCRSQGLFRGYVFKEGQANVWEYIDPNEPESCKVLFAETESDLQSRSAPDNPPPAVLLPECALDFGPTLTLPPLESPLVWALSLEREERKRYGELVREFEATFSKTDDNVYHDHQLLGYPVQLQADMQLHCHMANLGIMHLASLSQEAIAALRYEALEWLHLFQIGTDQYAQVTWGEYGSLCYWIRQQDLRRGDFGRCCAISDSM